jgi:hypothetical protein
MHSGEALQLASSCRPRCRGQTPRPDVLQLQRYTQTRGLTPAPNSVSLAAAIPLEGMRRSRALGPAPDDLLTSYPGLGARAPCSVASAPARALVWSAHRPWPSTDFGFATSGPRVGAWMVCPPARRGIRTAALGSCVEMRVQEHRASHLRGARRQTHLAAPVMLRMPTSSTQKIYPRPLLRTGIGVRPFDTVIPGLVPGIQPSVCSIDLRRGDTGQRAARERAPDSRE